MPPLSTSSLMLDLGVYLTLPAEIVPSGTRDARCLRPACSGFAPNPLRDFGHWVSPAIARGDRT